MTNENERCGNCYYFRKLYVPPVDDYKDIPTDGYVCVMRNNPQWLGTDGQGAGNGMCEMFSRTRLHSNIDLYIKDYGKVRRIGSNRHDMLTITNDGKLEYRNLQCDEGAVLGESTDYYSYEFVPNEDDYGYNCDQREVDE